MVKGRMGDGPDAHTDGGAAYTAAHHEQLRTRGGRQEHLPRAPDFDMLDHRHVGKPRP